MFTGIVTDVGRLLRAEPLDRGVRLRIATHYDPSTIDIGASIACSGPCLTVTERGEDAGEGGWFEVEAWEEALRLTTIGEWQIGRHLNLERSLRMGDELGGHLVSGHVDGTAEIIDIGDEGEAMRFHLNAPAALAPFIAQKGSIALDGASLTVNSVDDTHFDVLLIRHTLAVTTWGERRAGDRVNIEVDQMARYAARLAGWKTTADKA